MIAYCQLPHEMLFMFNFFSSLLPSARASKSIRISKQNGGGVRKKVFHFDEHFIILSTVVFWPTFACYRYCRYQTWKFHHSLLWAFIIEFIGSVNSLLFASTISKARFTYFFKVDARHSFVPPPPREKRGRKNANISEKIFFHVALKFPYLIVILIFPTIVTQRWRRFTSADSESWGKKGVGIINTFSLIELLNTIRR